MSGLQNPPANLPVSANFFLTSDLNISFFHNHQSSEERVDEQIFCWVVNFHGSFARRQYVYKTN